jgi:hypothetical protein
MNGIGSVLGSFQPRVIERIVPPSEFSSIPGAYYSKVNQNDDASVGISTKKVLAKYDLHNIDQNDLESLAAILHERHEISDETAASLMANSLSVYEGSPNNVKKDFIGAIEERANTFFNGKDYNPSNEIDGLISDNLKHVINEAKSIDYARQTGSGKISINLNV